MSGGALLKVTAEVNSSPRRFSDWLNITYSKLKFYRAGIPVKTGILTPLVIANCKFATMLVKQLLWRTLGSL